MKILHTGDWHLGKIVNQVYMTSEQEYILNQLLKIIDEEQPDVLIISGDLFDRGVPPVEAVELLDKVLSEILLVKNLPVIAIAGNHDSADRIAFGNRILEKNGLYIEGRINSEIRKVVFKDKFGSVNFYLLPYAEPMEVKHVFNIDDVHNHNDAFKVMVDKIKEEVNYDERNIIVAHGYIRGLTDLEKSDSERPLTVGGTEYADALIFKGFEYTALGHLHGAQKVTGNTMRYAGSLLKYSFSEIKQNKSAALVVIGEKGKEPEITLKPLVPKREMRIIKGKLKELIAAAKEDPSCSDDYIRVILTDEGELIDPMNKIRTVYPNVMELIREEQNKSVDKARTSAGAGYKSKNKLELFKDFYENISGTEFTKEKEAITAEVIKQVSIEEGERV